MLNYLTIFLFICLNLEAQVNDSIIRLKDLEFKTNFEKEAFYRFSTSNKSSYLPLFLTSFSGRVETDVSDIEKRLSSCIEEIKIEIAGKSEPKQVKFIYKYVHDHFFSTYRLKNSFADIFSRGEYNCVSASALYALIFQQLAIPFTVMEAPRHIFLIAYPASHKILIESTSPDDGYNTYSESQVDKYVRSLYAAKVISREEFENKPVRQLFEKYYYASSDIDLKQLAGIQYSNYGLYDNETENYTLAAKEFKKAYYLNSDIRGRYLLRSALSFACSSKGYKDMKQVEDLALLCIYNNRGDEEVTNEYVKNEFARVIHAQLIESTDEIKFEQSYKIITTAIKDSVLIKDISFMYHYELGRLGLLDLKPDKLVLEHLKLAAALKPDHANLQSLIIAQYIQKIEKNKQVNDIVKINELYEKAFPFMAMNKHFLGVKANCYLELAYEDFALRNPVGGEAYLKDFVVLVSREDSKEVEPQTYYVEKAYSEAASLFYKKGNKVKAKQLLLEGLKYAPNSFALKVRLSQL